MEFPSKVKVSRINNMCIDVKNVIYVFLVTFFCVFNVFFIFQTFFYLKKRWQSSERQAD